MEEKVPPAPAPVARTIGERLRAVQWAGLMLSFAGLVVAFGVPDPTAGGRQFLGDIIDSGVCHQAIFRDPAGNVLDLHHRYAPPEARPGESGGDAG